MVFKRPVRRSPSLKTNIAATVMVAGLLNPANPSLGLKMPDANNKTIMIIAATSNETYSVEKRINAKIKSRKTKIISMDIAAANENKQSSGQGPGVLNRKSLFHCFNEN